MNTQPIPPSATLLAQLPSGREYFSNLPAYQPPQLDANAIAQMRAPPSPSLRAGQPDDDDSDDDDGDGRAGAMGVPGGFPGSAGNGGRSGGGSEYY